jgi:hypothetical protein
LGIKTGTLPHVFQVLISKHPQSEKLSGYYRLVESYRNAENRVCHRTNLNVGFMEDVTADQLNRIQKQLTERYGHKQPIFRGEDDPAVKKYVEELWQRIVASKKLGLAPAEKLSRMVNMDTLQHSNARGSRCGEYSVSDMGKTAAHSAAALPGVYPGAGHACRHTGCKPCGIPGIRTENRAVDKRKLGRM